MGSASCGVGSPSIRHRSVKCAWAEARSPVEMPRHLWANSAGVSCGLVATCPLVRCLGCLPECRARATGGEAGQAGGTPAARAAGRYTTSPAVLSAAGTRTVSYTHLRAHET